MAKDVAKRRTEVPVKWRCAIRTCPERRAVLSLPDGRTGKARKCHRHLSPKLREYVTGSVKAYSGSANSDNENAGTLPKKKLRTDGYHTGTGLKCGAILSKHGGKPCGRPAGWGTRHPGYGNCKLHGGASPNHDLAAAKQEAEASAVVMGLPIDIDPLDALLHCVRVSAGEVQYCSLRIHSLKESDATVQHKETEIGEGEKGYKNIVKRSTATDLNIWIRARQGALERLAKFSKMAIDAGVAERQVKVAETMGTQIGILIQGILTGLQLSKRQWQIAPEVVREHLAVIEGVATEVRQ